MAAAMDTLHSSHMVQAILNESKHQKTDKMSSTILNSFDKIKSDNDSARLNAGVALLNHLCRYNVSQDDKELNYAFNRLVRSLGSSTEFARRGFYSTLTVFLTMCPDISIEKLLSIMNTQLHPADNNAKSENTNIYIGRILLCGAFIRSKLLVQSNIKIQQQVIEILMTAGKQRTYLSSISVIFLNEFIIQLNIQSMKKVVWPIIEKEISKPWSEQTLDSFYLLLVIRDNYPSLINHKFLKEHLNVNDIIVKESIEDIIKLLMSIPRNMLCHHPGFKMFCKELTTSNLIPDFWHCIDQRFTKPSKNDECIAIEILKSVLPNIIDKNTIPSLLSPNFLRYMLRRFTNSKKSNDEILVAFREVLHLVASTTNDKDVKTKTQLNILKRIILLPGGLMIEKKTSSKVIQIITGNLRLDGIKKLCHLYRDIIENKIIKEKGEDDTITELWTNAERSYAAQLLTKLMGHPETLADQEWRLTELISLFNYGFCEVSDVGTELASQFKDSFYRALDYKLPKLHNVQDLLSALFQHLNSNLQSNTMQLRSPLSNTASNAWKRILNLIEKLKKNKNNTGALLVFHIMNLHMSLQLFSEPDMAIMSINELHCCYERLIKESKNQVNVNTTAVNEEPNWVEVVVDLLLSLLSRNNHLLRSLVGCVFPHICPYLTSSAIYQILDVLDVKNNQNMLTSYSKENEDSSDTENELDDDDGTEDNISNSEISSEEDESECDSETLDENETMTDRLRIAVREALGDAATQTDDEDIDVDQINDDEAKRLDQSLAAAFKILRENRQSRSKKQEKTNQALTHFRVRVIDLLNIYLENCPSMLITLNMIVPLFALLEFCIKDPHQKPLEHRVRVCLKKLSVVKKFKNTTGLDENLLTIVLKELIEKGERSTSICQEISDKLAECCTFLVRCVQQANISTEAIVDIYIKNITAFFQKRDSILSSTLFKSVLQLCWEGNWQLAPVVVDFAFDSNIRYFRRNQALELLLIFYNNNRLLCMDIKHSDMKIKLETALYNNAISTFENNSTQSTSSSDNDVGKKVHQKFIGLLFTLLRVVYTHHSPQVWNWQNIKTILIKYRNQNVLSKETKKTYNKLAMQIGIPLNGPSVKNNIKLSKNKTDIVFHNNNEQNNVQILNGRTDNVEAETLHSNNIQKKKKRTKSKQRDKQLLKKETRELRQTITSKDFESFSFSTVNLPQNQMEITEVSQNGDLHNEFTNSKYLRKRSHEQLEDKNSKFKRKRSIE